MRNMIKIIASENDALRYLLLGSVVAVSVAAVIAGGCSDDGLQPATQGSVFGVILEVERGTPVRDAELVLLDPSSLRLASAISRTDSTGKYSITNVNPGRYTVLVYHDSLVIYEWPSALVSVVAGLATEHDLLLQNSQLWNGSRPWVSGTVSDAETGRPIGGAYVETAWSAGDDLWAPFFGTTYTQMRVTDELGHFTLKDLATFSRAGAYFVPPITVTSPGYMPFSLVGRGPDFLPGLGSWLPRPVDGELKVEIRLRRETSNRPQGAVHGQLVHIGLPVAGIRVGLSVWLAANPDTFPSAPQKTGGLDGQLTSPLPDKVAVSDSHGEFLIPDVPLGTYIVMPAYEVDDGYTSGLRQPVEGVLVHVAGDTVIDAGVIELRRALHAVFPPDGSVVDGDSLTELHWEEIPSPGADYHFQGYRVSISDDYILDYMIDVQDNRWTLPNRIRPGAHMRWIVRARFTQGVAPDTLLLGSFERAATFTVD